MVEFKTHDLRRRSKPFEEKSKVEPEKVQEELKETPVETAEVVKPEPPVIKEEPEVPQAAAKTADPAVTDKAPASGPARRKPQRRTLAKPADKKPPAPRRTPAPRTSRASSSSPKKTEPVIGITCAFEHLPDKSVHSQQYFYIYRTYISAIHEAGGIPIIIPVGLEKRYNNKVLEIIDGYLIPGAEPDLDPTRYGDLPNEQLGRVVPRMDRAEIELFNLAFNANKPILGICRGCQVINVALDGTLYQDVSSQVRMSMNHHPKMPPSEIIHRLDITRNSKLHQIFEETEIWVNSDHHQAVKLTGKGLIVTAKAADGITEAIEHPTKKWVIGVQWHPELLWMRDPLQAKLFKEFIEACKG
jgi:putative glutamine amidotransferase